MAHAILGPEASSNPQPTFAEQAVTLARGLGREVLRVGTFRDFAPDRPYRGSDHFQHEVVEQPEVGSETTPKLF